MPPGKRRPWRDEDNTALIALWDAIGSVSLIAIMLKRSRSSVQTQASRLGLPPRAEESDRHRRRWAEGDDAKLDALMAELTGPGGAIPIQQLAERMGRSVDAVVARIEIRHVEESDVMERLAAPPMPVAAPPCPKPAGAAVADKAEQPQGKMKRCLRCRKNFWSAGNHNWICISCKRSEDWDYD